MSSISQIRHTFSQIDSIFPQDSVSTLDNFFKELDVATYMVEGKVRNTLARAGYHTLRGVALAIEQFVYTIFITIKGLANTLRAVGQFSVRVAETIFIAAPMVVQRVLFPSAADQHDKRVNEARKALKEGTFSVETIIGPETKKHTYKEQKELMQTLLIQPVRAQPDAKPEWKEFCTLMQQIADGDLRADELKAKEDRVKAITKQAQKEKKPHIPHFALLTDTFLKAFRSERDYESHLSSNDIKKSPTLLLKYPHLLLRKEFEEIISDASDSLKKQLMCKKRAMQQRVLKQAHKKELAFLATLPSLLKNIDLNDVREIYDTEVEEKFLEQRLELIEQRIQKLKRDGKQAGFEYSYLKFEQHHLTQQQEGMQKTQEALEFLEEHSEHLEELNTLHANSGNLICQALISRIQETLDSPALAHCLPQKSIASLYARLKERLEEIPDLESTEEQLKVLQEMYLDLHDIEMHMIRQGQDFHLDLERIQKSRIECEKLHQHITLAHDVKEWEAFTSLTSSQHREEARQNALTSDVLCMLIETKAECQVPLLLAKQDTRSLYQARFEKTENHTSAKGVVKEIETASQEFVDAVRDKYHDTVKKRLLSITEFVSQVEAEESFEILEENKTLKKQEKHELLDFRTTGLTLDLAEDLNRYYTKLQAIWIEHMPREQEEMLNLISSSKLRKLKMAECFEQWFEMKSGKKLGVSLSFEHLILPNHADESKAALKELKGHFAIQKKAAFKNEMLMHEKEAALEEIQDLVEKGEAEGKIEELRKKIKGFPSLVLRAKENIKEALQGRKAKQRRLQGISPRLIMNEREISKLTSPQDTLGNSEEIKVTSSQFEDIVTGLERIKTQVGPVVPGKELEWRIQWTQALHGYAETTNSLSLRQMILGECKHIIRMCFTGKKDVPRNIQTIFFYHATAPQSNERPGQINWETIHNFERADFLAHFLLMSFSSRKSVALSEEQYLRLLQICSLSSLPQGHIDEILKFVQTVNSAPVSDFSNVLMQISRQVQSSPIGLEGVEAEIVYRSIKNSALPTDSRTRSLLDAYMSRGTDALSFHLIDHVYAHHAKNLHHHQGREAIARALLHAHSLYPEETKQYVLDKIEENKAAIDVDPRTLAPSLYVFYCDILRHIDQDAYFASVEIQQNIQKFNLGLLAVNDANQLLLGFARIISDLSCLILYNAEQGQSLDDLPLAFLQYKIAFQNIKKNYFEGKVEIKDFLKIDTDLAESFMVIAEPFVKNYFTTPANAVKIQTEIKKWTTLSTGSLEQCVKGELGSIRNEPTFKQTKIDGFFALSPEVVLDTMTGIVYHDGQQKIQLPAHLQNHPSTRVLGIHNFSFIWVPEVSGYVYHIKQENGESRPHLIVKNVDQKPVIYKRLVTSFQGDEASMKLLHFVPKDEVHLPISTLHRMGVQHFWQNDEQKLFGYNNDGKLVVIMDSSSVMTENGNYFFLTEEQKQDMNQHPVLSLLCKNFDINEILVDQTLSTYYVPALGLKLSKEGSKSGKEYWVCKIKGMTDKVLAASRSSPLLVIKNKADPKKLHRLLRGLKEARYRRQLARAEHPSHKENHRQMQLEKAVVQQKNKLIALEEPQFMTTCPDAAYQTEDVQRIIEMLPNQVRGEFLDFIGEMPKYPYEAYALTLHYLRGLIDEENQQGSDQKKVSPLLAAFLEIQKQYECVCDKPLEVVYFDRTYDNSALTKDLTGALTIAINQLATDDPDLAFLIKELSKYPLKEALTSSQIGLLQRAIKRVREAEEPNVPFEAYLLFMCYQHFLFKVRELAVTPLSDKQQILREVQQAYQDALDGCQESIKKMEQLNDEEKNALPKELLALWKKVGIQREHELLEEADPKNTELEKRVNLAVATELRVLGSKDLLDRLASTHIVEAVPKDPQKELTKHQKELSGAFAPTSQSQVAGFYLEKMGYFSLRELYGEFRLNEGDKALFGLRKADLDEIFEFLKESHCIQPAPYPASLFCLSSAHVAGKGFPTHQLRARLTHLPLSQQALDQVIERLHTFLFRAMQSGFEFSFKEGTEANFNKKLEQEKQIHLQHYLEAEAILKKELPKHQASMVDLKYAYLTGDYGKFSPSDDTQKELARLSHAMTRYLFHKTEVQHIENAQKAPIKGERNKIQLLHTKRSYSVDLLLQEGLDGAKRKEQIMQRAYLVFEEDYGNRCNMMQIRIFSALMLGKIDAIQARMGFGKTVLLPLLAEVKIAIERTKPVKDRQLVRYIVPRAVLEDNTSAFNQRLVSTLGKNVVQDRDFSRYQIDKDNPKMSFDLVIIDLKARLHLNKEMLREGHIAIQPPEIRCSMEAQDLDFSEMLRTNTLDEEVRDLCLEAKRLLVELRSIPTYNVYDELDDTQDFRSREVNFTRGAKLPIPESTIRPLEKVITYIEQHKNQDWSDKRTRAEEMVQALCTDRTGVQIDRCPRAVIDYLSEQSVEINEETKALLSKKLADGWNDPHVEHTENDSLFFLIRMVLLDEYVLSLVRNKQPNTHYGVRFFIEPGTGERRYSYDPDSRSALLISVPYEGVNTPKGLSVFDNREVAVITTLRYYLSNETSFDIFPHLDFLVTQIQQDAIPEALANYYLPGNGNQEHQIVQDLRKLSKMLDVDELRKAKEEFHEKFMRLPTREFRQFFGMVVVATQIRADEACAKSDRYEQGNVKDTNLGCSGTVGDTSSYFTKQAPDPAADGMLSLEIMGRDNNSVIEWLTPVQPTEDYLPTIIKTLLDHTKPNTRAIADIAGICKSRDGTPETVVQELWKQLKSRPQFADIEGIIYYGKDNVKRLYRGKGEPILCTTDMELTALSEGKKYFSFYKQKNCRGSDIKQAHGVHCLVTLDENVSNSDAKQTILRMRNIVTKDSGQFFSFAAMPEYRSIVLEGLKAEKMRALKNIDKELADLPQQIMDAEQALKKDKTNTGLKEALLQLKDARVALNVRKTQLNETIKQISDLNLKAKDVAYFLRLQEKNAEEDNALTIFRKEMRAHIKVAAFHLESELLSKLPKDLSEEEKEGFILFLQKRNAISPFVERSLNGLHEKYGRATKGMTREALINEEKRKALEALKLLYTEAEALAHKYHQVIKTPKKMYQERISESIKAFKKRFGEDKTVYISTTQSDGQNVAQAQAQAQALAEAEACSETITQTLLETQERLWSPIVTMAKNPREPVDLSFLEDDTLLIGIDGFSALENSIKPSLRSHFYLSPSMQMKNEMSHYVLKDTAIDRFIFISFAEAEVFKRWKEAAYEDHSMPFASLACSRYTLHDLRRPEKSVDSTPASTILPNTSLSAQLVSVALGDNHVPDDLSKVFTKDLRTHSPDNVESYQLLPQMNLKYNATAARGYFVPKVFGLDQEIRYSVAIDPTKVKDQLEIKVAVPAAGVDFSVALPLNNGPLQKYIPKVFNDGSVRKNIEEVYRQVHEEYERIFPQLAELEKKKKKLEALNRQNQQMINSVDNFELTPKMKKGLLERDGKRLARPYDIGREMINICAEIYQDQQELKKSLSMKALLGLKEKFGKLVSQGVIHKTKQLGFDYCFDPLFDVNEWNRKVDDPNAPILEKVYGRIVYSVHGGDVGDARACSLEDCNQMFETVIPNLLKVIPELQRAIVEIEKNEEEREKIENEIQVLVQQAKPWAEAVECLEKMLEREKEVEKTLAQHGLHYEQGTFFNQFRFDVYPNAPEAPTVITIHGEMPEYRLMVEKDMKLYEQIFKGLTVEETQMRAKNKAFLQRVLQLARQIENRETEVHDH